MESIKLIELSYPILIYDNLCYSCTRWAQMVNKLLKNSCLIVGHYTSLGKEMKKQIFPKDYDGLEMSWFIIDGYAYGGRAGLFRLIQYVIFGQKKRNFPKNEFNLSECDTDCKTRKGMLFRMWNIATKYRKFKFIT